MKVAIFGAGYVGCVTAASLASLGHTVWLVESSDSKRSALQAAECPIVEPGMDPVLPDHIRKKNILPVADSQEAIASTELALICVGTPSLPDGATDIRQVQAVWEEMIAALENRRTPYVIALRSTIPYPLLASQLIPKLKDAFPDRYGKDIYFALNPEFLREGTALKDFVTPPFVIIGTAHPEAAACLKNLYRDVQAPLHVISLGSASLLKYACNAFHALKITFANEMASFSTLFEADANETMDIFRQDNILNISPAYLRPGFAYGGSCLPKDLKTLSRLSAMSGLHTPVLEAIEKSNTALIEKTVQTVIEFGTRKIGLIGLTFKTGTDDFRNSPLVELAERLLGKGIELSIWDPDIDMRKIHGQNLRFIEQRLPHLAQALSSDVHRLIERSELVIIGKPLPKLSAILDQLPSDRWILDLTRQLPQHSDSGRLRHVESLANA